MVLSFYEDMKKTYFVKGGVYTDDSFTTLITEEEALGPFASREEAHTAWENLSWRYVDEALRCYRIECIESIVEDKGVKHQTLKSKQR